MNLAPENRDYFKKRDEIQLKIDDWYKKNPNNKWARRI